MSEGTFNPISFYAVPTQSADLALFDSANDLPMTNTAVAYDSKRIEAGIEFNARRAHLQSDAESALWLAILFKDDAHRHLEHLERAEAAAFNLGTLSFQRGRTTTNPFLDIALATAWYNGYNDAARHPNVVKPCNDLEAKLWNDGIDTETGDSHYELVALSLLRLADISDDPRATARAQRLAQEMLAYQQGVLPSPRRQQEIDRFLKLQTQRLAAAIDFNDF